MTLLRRLTFLALLAGTASCGFVKFDGCAGRPLVMNTMAGGSVLLWPGETTKVSALVGPAPDEGCDKAYANSDLDPEMFTFTSDDSSVAAVSPTGVVTAKAIGAARVIIEWNGIGMRDTVAVSVLPRVSEIRIVARDTAALGDTISVTAVPLDAAGNEMPTTNIGFGSIYVTHPASSRAIQPIPPYTVAQFRFAAVQRGTYTISIRTVHAPYLWGTARVFVP